MSFSMSGNSNWSYNRFDAYEAKLKEEKSKSCDKCKGKCECDEKKEKKSGSKPDYLDFDKDGNKEEPMKDALKGKKEESEEVSEGLKHREADTGKVVDKAEVGKTYYTDGPRQKSSVAKRKEAEDAKLKKEEVEQVDEAAPVVAAIGKAALKGVVAGAKPAAKAATVTAAGNLADRATRKEELEATGLFSAEEINSILG